MDFFQAEKVFNSALVALIGYATLIAKQHVGGRKNGSFEECRVLHQKDISSSILKDVTASLKLEQVQFNNWWNWFFLAFLCLSSAWHEFAKRVLIPAG